MSLTLIQDSSKLQKGQLLKVDLERIKDRLPENLLKRLAKNAIGTLVGYKMVDGNQFGLVLQLEIGTSQWFFEEELSEI